MKHESQSKCSCAHAQTHPHAHGQTHGHENVLQQHEAKSCFQRSINKLSKQREHELLDKSLKGVKELCSIYLTAKPRKKCNITFEWEILWEEIIMVLQQWYKREM